MATTEFRPTASMDGRMRAFVRVEFGVTYNDVVDILAAWIAANPDQLAGEMTSVRVVDVVRRWFADHGNSEPGDAGPTPTLQMREWATRQANRAWPGSTTGKGAGR